MRRFHRPFVVTIAATVASVACGGSTTSNPAGTTPDTGVAPTDAGSGDATTDVANDAADAADAASDAADAGTDADATAPCPQDPPDFGGDGWQTCTLPASKTCHYDIACQSGTVSLDFSCENSSWQIAQQQACAQPYDSCPGTSLRCTPVSGWIFDVNYNYNPPGPCPSTAPAAGDACQPGGFGGDPEACGYPCSGTSGWTVLRCDFSDAGTASSTWTSDNACHPG